MINDYELAREIREYDVFASILVEKIPTVSYFTEHRTLPYRIRPSTRNRIIEIIEDSEKVEPDSGLLITKRVAA
tara:strand:+ start:89 stop:310 length:222 start_codon:yes stop_codon:yes gene_type:complete